jgi:hypothetical protein
MKKIFLIVCLGMFLGAASVSASEISGAHKKAAKTEMKFNKTKPHKAHKAHKKGVKKNASMKSEKTAPVKQ